MTKYQPTEAEIERVLSKAGSDPRKLAIAYLKAQRRARDWEAGFHMMDGLSQAMVGATTGDLKSAKSGLDHAKRTLNGHKQATERR